MKRLSKMVILIASITLLLYIFVNKYNFDVYLSQIGSKNTIENQGEFIEKLREAMLGRKEIVTLKYKGSSEDVNEFVGEAIDKVFLIDDVATSSDCDYLKYCYKATQITIKGILDSFTITYVFEYNESEEETKEVDHIVKEVLNSMNINELSDYEKIKQIHDYIINNSEYDLTLSKNTAYDNLVLKTSVCQGYAMLTYKMMLEAGIESRIITGMGKNVSHAWNIVKLDDKWYNIDCTWDDPVAENRTPHLEYRYFLKASGEFKDHIRDEEFMTEEFESEYPMARNSY